MRRFSTLVLFATLIGSLLTTSLGGRALAASGGCFLVGEPSSHYLSLTDLSDIDPDTNEATIGWSSNSHVGPAAVQPGTGVLFAIEAPKLGTIDTGTGDFTSLAGGISNQTGALGPQNLADVRGLAFDPTSGTLFGVAGHSGAGDLLFQLDPTTGNTVDDAFGLGIGYVEIVSDKAAQRDFYGLAIDGGGQMRAMGNDGNSQWKLHEIDKTDGAALDVLNSSEVADLSHDAAGNLWGLTSGGALFELYSAEPSRTLDNFPLYSALACVAGAGAGNTAPALQAIGDQSGPEGSAITFDAEAIDTDLPTQTLTFSLDAIAGGHSLPATYSWDPATGIFSWTPSESEGGTSHTFVVVVADNGSPVASDTETITLTANETNLDVVADAITNPTIPEMSPYSFTATAVDLDLPANDLTWSIVTGPPAEVTVVIGDSLDPKDLIVGVGTTVIWTNVDSQRHRMRSRTGPVEFDSGNLEYRETFQFTFSVVGTYPYVDERDETDSAYHGSVVVTASAPPGAPGVAAITTGGAFSWTPTEAQGPGTYPVTLRVSDGMSTSDVSFSIAVTEVNTDVVADAITNLTIPEMVSYGFTATATDTDHPTNTLTWTLVTGPTGAAISGGGAFTWTPTEAQGPGSHPVTLRVSDGLSTSDVSFSIAVTEVNTDVVADAITNPTIPEMVSYGFTATATDTDHPTNTLTWTLVTGPTGAAISGGGAFTWTPTEAQGPGSHPVTLRVSDGFSTSDVSFTINVTEVNTDVVADAITNPTIPEMVSYGFTATATDTDHPTNTLTWTLVTGPTGAAISGGGAFTWTPTEAQGPGSHPVTLRVSDGSSTSDVSFTINVTEVNTDVVADAITNPTIPEMVSYGFTATATDTDHPTNTLTWTLVTGPTGAAISGGGAFTWTPTEAQGPGSHPVTLRVSDGSSTSDVSFTINVTEVAEPPPPPITPPPPPVVPPPATPPPPPVEPTPVEPVPPPIEPPVEPVPEPVVIEPVSAVVTSAARKEVVVEALSGFETAPADTSGRSVTRTLVTMSGVTVAAVRSLGMPFVLLVGLGLMVATIGNVSIFPLIGRSRRRQGTVARFNAKSRYGFIVADADSTEVFVHGATLRRRNSELAPGQRVSYRVIKGSHRDFALAVRTIDS